MDYSIKNVIATSLLLILTTCQCHFTGRHRISESLLRRNTNESFLGFSDSLMKALPVVPDDYLISGSHIQEREGLELVEEDKCKLLTSGIGIIFPKGIKVNSSDIKNRFAPRIKMFLIGRWIVSESINYYLLKCLFDGGLFVYLLPVKDSSVFDSALIAYSLIERENEEDIICGDSVVEQALMSVRCSDTVTVYSVKKDMNLHVERLYRLTSKGGIDRIR